MLTDTVRVAPAAAKRVWESQENPTNVSVARALSRPDAPFSPRKVARWKIREWVDEDRARALQKNAAAQPEKVPEPALNPVINPFKQPQVDKNKLVGELNELSTADLIARTIRDACITQTVVGRAVTQSLDDLLQKPADLSKLLDQSSQSLASLVELFGRFEEQQRAAEQARKEIELGQSKPNNSIDWSAFGRAREAIRS